MKRFFWLLTTLLLLAITASATELTVMQKDINNFRYAGVTVPGSCKLRIYASGPLVTGGSTGANKIIQPGSPPGTSFYQEIGVTLSLKTVNGVTNVPVATIAQFIIDSTTDAINDKGVTYSAFFFTTTGRMLGSYEPFTNFAMPPVTDTGVMATWEQISLYNTGTAPIPPQVSSYSQDAINYLLTKINAVSVPSGLTTGDLVAGAGPGMFGRFPASGVAGLRFLTENNTSLAWYQLGGSDISTALGYTPFSSTGGNITGAVTMVGGGSTITLAASPTDSSPSLQAASVGYVKTKVGGIANINLDATAQQTLTVNASFPNLTITDNAAGDHKFGFSGLLNPLIGGTGVSNYSTGDLLIANGLHSLTTVSIGASNNLPFSNGTTLAYRKINASTDFQAAIALPADNGGTGIRFFQATGPTLVRTYTFPDANATIFTSNGTVPAINGGSGISSFTIGDTLAADSTTTLTKIAGNITTTRKFYRELGSGAAATVPVWDTVRAVDIDPSTGGPLVFSQGGSGVSSLSAGVIKSTGTVLSSIAILDIASGGSNASSFANSNGVVTYDGTRLVSIAQGAAGTLLAGGAGAPGFTATPTVTSLTLSGLSSVSTPVAFLSTAGLFSSDATNFLWDNSAKQLNLKGSYKFFNNSGGIILFPNAAMSGTYNYKFPAARPGGALYSLVGSPNGDGVSIDMSWVNVAGGGGGGITAINGSSDASFVLTTDTTTSDFGVTTLSDGLGTTTITYHLPAASTSASGKITTGSQSFAGVKTFQDGITMGTNTGVPALLTLAAGTNTAAAFRFTSGVNLTSMIAGTVEWDGTHQFITQTTGPTRKQFAFIDDTITGNAAGFTGNLAGDISGPQGTTVYNGIVPTNKGGSGQNLTIGSGQNGMFLGVVGGIVALTVNGASLTGIVADNVSAGTLPLARIANLNDSNWSAAGGDKLTWAKVNKAGSSLADLATRNAGDISTGVFSSSLLDPGVAVTFSGGVQLVNPTAGQLILGFAPGKDIASGYAGLTAGTKLKIAEGQEVWGLADLSDVTSTSGGPATGGSGDSVILLAISGLANGDVATYESSTSTWKNKPATGVANHNLLSTTHGDTTPGSVGVGGLIYGADSVTPTWTQLAAGSANRVLVSVSGSNGVIPAWQQVNLTSMVTGTLPFTNGGWGITAGNTGGIPYFSTSSTIASSATLTSDGVLLGKGAAASPVATAAGSAYQPLRVPSGGGSPAFGALDLSQSAAVTGILQPANGGIGTSNSGGAYKLLPVSFVDSGSVNTATTSVNNQVRVYRFRLDDRLVVTTMTVWIGNAGGGGSQLIGFGIYDAAGTTLLVDSGPKTATVNAVTATVVSGPITLAPGYYYLATTATAVSTVPQFDTISPGAIFGGVLNTTVTQLGTAANASVAGQLPATLGVITGVATQAVPIVKLQN